VFSALSVLQAHALPFGGAAGAQVVAEAADFWVVIRLRRAVAESAVGLVAVQLMILLLVHA
jgi:hypothetical protein